MVGRTTAQRQNLPLHRRGVRRAGSGGGFGRQGVKASNCFHWENKIGMVSAKTKAC
jgi:hypothetical protein